jgi:hypothetical protein
MEEPTDIDSINDKFTVILEKNGKSRNFVIKKGTYYFILNIDKEPVVEETSIERDVLLCLYDESIYIDFVMRNKKSNLIIIDEETHYSFINVSHGRLTIEVLINKIK